MSGCNKPSVERTQANKAYYEYCLIYVDIFNPKKIPEDWNMKRIEYLTSNNFEVKYEKLKEAVENYKAVMTDKDKPELETINRHIDTIDKFIFYAKKFNELGIKTNDEIFTKMTDEERLGYAGAETSMKITYDAMLEIIDVWNKSTPVYVD